MLTIIVFLLLGAMANGAVAWACVAWSNGPGLTHGSFSDRGTDSQGRFRFHINGVYIKSAGLPMPTVEGYADGWPTQPLWPGFAVNTLFYAGILWLLFAAPFALRRRRRIKRGLCPACAYPVGESTVCTECGKPVAGRGVKPQPL